MSGSPVPATQPKSTISTIVKWVVGVMVILAVGVVPGAIYQSVGTWQDSRRFPQRGKSVQAGQVMLNIDCSGDRKSPANPEVILDSGIGVPAVGWIKLQPEVAKFARVCSYDRAGWR